MGRLSFAQVTSQEEEAYTAGTERAALVSGWSASPCRAFISSLGFPEAGGSGACHSLISTDHLFSKSETKMKCTLAVSTVKLS